MAGRLRHGVTRRSSSNCCCCCSSSSSSFSSAYAAFSHTSRGFRRHRRRVQRSTDGRAGVRPVTQCALASGGVSNESSSGRTTYGRQEADLDREKARFWSGSGYGGTSAPPSSDGASDNQCGIWDKERLFGEGGALPDWDGSWPPPWFDALEPWNNEKEGAAPSSEEMQSLLFEIMANGSTAARVSAIIGRRELVWRQARRMSAAPASSSTLCVGAKELLCLIATLGRARDFKTARFVHDYIVRQKIPVLCRHYLWLVRLRLQDTDAYALNTAAVAPTTDGYEALRAHHQGTGADANVIDCLEWLMRSGATPSADACELVAGLQYYHKQHGIHGQTEAMLSQVVDWLRAETDVGRTMFDHYLGEWERRAADTSSWEAAMDSNQWRQVEEAIDNAGSSGIGSFDVDANGDGVIENIIKDVQREGSAYPTADFSPRVRGMAAAHGTSSSKEEATSRGGPGKVQYGPDTVFEAEEKRQLAEIEEQASRMRQKELDRIRRQRSKQEQERERSVQESIEQEFPSDPRSPPPPRSGAGRNNAASSASGPGDDNGKPTAEDSHSSLSTLDDYQLIDRLLGEDEKKSDPW